jgi:hypothetical protein
VAISKHQSTQSEAVLSLSSLFSPSSSSSSSSSSSASGSSSNSFGETTSTHDMNSLAVNANAEVVTMTECISESTDDKDEFCSSLKAVTAPSSSSKHSPSYSANKSPLCHSCTADVDTEFVENSLLLYEHVSYIANDIFKKHLSFRKALKEGMNTFVNRDSTMVVPYSTTFEAMRGGSFDDENEKEQNQAFMRRNIRRHRRQVTGIGGFHSNRYATGYEKLRNGVDDVAALGYSSTDSDSDVHDTSKSDASDSSLRPSKIPRHVSWDSSGSVVAGLIPPESSECAAATTSIVTSLNGSTGKLCVPSFPSSTTSMSSSSYAATSCLGAASQVVMLASYCDRLLKVSA